MRLLRALRKIVAAILGPPQRCRSAIVELDAVGGPHLGTVVAACDLRDRHRGAHAGPDVHGNRIEWE